MKIKVCGITSDEQYVSISEMAIDMIGFNYYKASKRYLEKPIHKIDSTNPKRVGVFVNEPVNNLSLIYDKHQLDYAQLHGDEDIEYLQALAESVNIIKVIRVKDEINNFDFESYDSLVSYYLLDTYTEQYGGSGKKFNWELLNQIKTDVPLILSGGIRFEDLEELKALEISNLWGVDINSQFELEPGIKNLDKLKAFTEALNTENHESSQL